MEIHKIIPALVLAYSNSDFTNPHEVVLLSEPEDCKGQFTHMGAKYTGVETNRHKATSVNSKNQCLEYNHNAYNWLDIALKERALVSEIKASTRWYTGNQVRAISVILKDELQGTEKKVLDRVALAPDADHTFPIEPTMATESRIELYFEGGLSRIHFLGTKTIEQIPSLSNLLEKATILKVSDEHYGNPAMAVKGCRKEMHMVGWESARTGFGESALFKLDEAATIKGMVVDTYLHRLNAPLTCHLYGLSTDGKENVNKLLENAPRWKLLFDNGKEVIPENFQAYMLNEVYLKEAVPNPEQFQIALHLPEESNWKAIFPFEQLEPDTYNRFSNLKKENTFEYLLYMHYPNGGIHGLKVF